MHINDKDFSFKDILLYTKKYWSWLLFAAFSAALGTYVQFYNSSKYLATSRFSVEKDKGNQIQAITQGMMPGGLNANSGAGSTKRYLLFFESKDLGIKILEKLNKENKLDIVRDLEPTHNTFNKMIIRKLGLTWWIDKATHGRSKYVNDLLSNTREMLGLIRKSITATSEQSNIILVTARSNSPKASIELSNVAMQVAIEELMNNELSEIQSSKVFLQTQTEEAKERLDGIRKSINEVKNNTQNVDQLIVDSENQLKLLRNQLFEANTKKAQLEELIAKTKKSTPMDFATRNKLVKMQREYVFWDSKIASLQRVQMDVELSRPKLDSRNLSVEQAIQNLDRQKNFEYDYLMSLQKLTLNLNVKEISIKNKVKVLEAASRNSLFESKLPITGILAAIIVSMAIVIFLIIARESLAPEIKSLEDLERFNFLNFGSVPDLSFSQSMNKISNVIKKDRIPNEDEKNPLFTSPNTPQAFVFNAIRSKVFYKIEEDPKSMKVITMTSPRQGEGKTMLSGKIAHSMAKTGFKILLVDGDLIRADLSQQLGLGNTEGFFETMSGKKPLSEVVVQSELEENLYVLPAGKERGSISDLLLTRASSQFFSDCRENFDYILIDTPALLVAPDSVLMCRFSDITAVVVSAGQTKIEDVTRTFGELQAGGVEVIGCILNRFGSLMKYYYYKTKFNPFSRDKSEDKKPPTARPA